MPTLGTNNSRLRELDLRDNATVSRQGWKDFSLLLENPICCLEIIDLRKCATDWGDFCYPRINDDVLLSFANGLAVNRSVKHFLLDDMSDRIGPTGWSKFYQTLFGERILDTYHSNHALEKLHSDDEKSAWFNFLSPRDLEMCLSINRGNDRIQAAWLKIIWKHFSGRVISVQPLTDMELNVLPHAIAWIGRDSNDHR